jgi:hypothetical protein
MPTTRWLLALALTGGAVGCQEGNKPLLPVTGKVAYRGYPVPGGTIVFTPDARRGQSGPLAVGKINADGTYSLRTGESFGAVAGFYRVTVAAVTAGGDPLPGQLYHIPVSLVPEKYRDPERSGLSCEVKGERANAIDFNLTD